LVSALEIQDAYLSCAKKAFAGRDRDTDWVLAAWADVLNKLATDPMSLVGTCDWVTKKWLIDSFCESEGLSWDNPDDVFWMQSQDLEYHNVDRDSGLYFLLEAQGQMVRVVDDKEIAQAMSHPPSDTRAYFRGRCLEKFGDYVVSINWDRIVFQLGNKQHAIDMKNLVDIALVKQYNGALDRADTLDVFIKTLQETVNQ
jgi:proteasome accessory factor A